MGINYLWDTNTVIYFLQGLLPEEAEIRLENIMQQSMPAISVITEIELLCWKTASDKDIKILEKFINKAFLFELETETKRKTAEIRKKSGLKLPDAIIAATAIVNNLQLITRDTKDFQKIEGLGIINLWA